MIKNIIYGDLSKQENLEFSFWGSNNILFLAGKAKNFNIEFKGDNSLIFIGDGVWFNTRGDIYIWSDCLCFMGDNTSCENGGFWIGENKNIIFGKDNQLSYELWFRTTDQHVTCDTQSNKLINRGKSIYVSDHCWNWIRLYAFKRDKYSFWGYHRGGGKKPCFK